MLKTIWKKWKRIVRIIADFQARVILTILYFILVTPIALVMVFFDPLRIKHQNIKWILHSTNNLNTDLLEEAKRQF